MENKIWGSFKEWKDNELKKYSEDTEDRWYFLNDPYLQDSWNARNFEVEELKNKNMKLQKEIDRKNLVARGAVCEVMCKFFRGDNCSYGFDDEVRELKKQIESMRNPLNCKNHEGLQGW